MNYNKIISRMAKQENVTKEEIEREMKIAIALAGLDCSPKQFITKVATMVKERRYIV